MNRRLRRRTRNGVEQIGLAVDELVGQQQVVIKTLEDNTDPVAGVSGATILGDGKVSLILDIAGLRRMQAHKPRLRAA
ncbi:MAG: chemotaxis protein CheW [Rickettsiales bacterium]|nr:chemotaxis protein CheW [Rickettsiales bacterium]